MTETTSRMKEYLARYTSDRRLASIVYKEIKKLNIKETILKAINASFNPLSAVGNVNTEIS